MDNRPRVALRARAHHLKSRITVGKSGVTETVIAEIRRTFEDTDLLKVRIQHPNRDEINRIVERISAAVPCETVGRVGFVATLYKPTEKNAE